MGEIKKVEKRYLLKESREAKATIENLAKKAKKKGIKAKKGTGLKILTPNKCFKDCQCLFHK